jgi:hypothetical protein
MSADKQRAHKLIEHLAPDQVPAAIGMLERLLDPVARAIANAPIDDEPLTAAEQTSAVWKPMAIGYSERRRN